MEDTDLLKTNVKLSAEETFLKQILYANKPCKSVITVAEFYKEKDTYYL